MNTLLKRASAGLAGGALLFSGLAIAGAPAASAATSPIDVTRINTGFSYGGSAINYSTKTVKVGTVANVVNPAALGQYGNAKVYADVFRGATRLQSNLQIAYVSSSGYRWAETSFSFKNSWGRGTFRLANVRVVWYDGNNTYTAVDPSVAGGAFVIKSAIDRSSARIKYSYRGSKRVASVKLKQFATNGRWVNHKRATVVLQRKQGKKWKKIKTLRTNSKGKASYTFYRGTKTKYRFVIKPKGNIAGGILVMSRKI